MPGMPGLDIVLASRVYLRELQRTGSRALALQQVERTHPYYTRAQLNEVRRYGDLARRTGERMGELQQRVLRGLAEGATAAEIRDMKNALRTTLKSTLGSTSMPALTVSIRVIVLLADGRYRTITVAANWDWTVQTLMDRIQVQLDEWTRRYGGVREASYDYSGPQLFPSRGVYE